MVKLVGPQRLLVFHSRKIFPQVHARDAFRGTCFEHAVVQISERIIGAKPAGRVWEQDDAERYTLLTAELDQTTK